MLTLTIHIHSFYLRSIRTWVHRLQMAMTALRLAGASFFPKEAPWGHFN